MKKEVKCPNCNKLVKWDSQSGYKPFCSERCKTIDLGNWANNSYSIPAEPATPEDLAAHIQGNNNNSE